MMSVIDNAEGLFFEGLANLENKNFATAESLFIETLRLAPRSIPTLNNLAIAQFSQSKFYDAALTSKRTIEIDPNNIDAYLMLANCQKEQNSYPEALATCETIIAIDSTIASAHCNRGCVLNELCKYEEALASLERAIVLQPQFYEAHLNRGNSLRNLKRYDEALVAYDKALALKPDLADVWLNRGNVFIELQRYDDASAAYDKALALKLDLAEAWLGRGNVFFDLRRYDQAAAAYDKALTFKSDLADAWLGRGNVFFDLRRYDEAFAAYDKAFALKPDLTGAEGTRLHSKMHLCDWDNFDAESDHLISSIKSNKANSNPLAFLAISASAEDQRQCAKVWVATTHPSSESPIWQGDRHDHDRIRIAYLSGDFREHPVSFLSAGMFECHNKSRFATTAISWGTDDNSEIRARIKKSFDKFIDVSTQKDTEVAELIRGMEIDIAVDLMGLTNGLRTGIFTSRPAPIQVNYLGYPGTMGTKYIDYIIADRILIPTDQYESFSEKIVLLPNSFQVNDRERRIADKIFTRAEVGLPNNGFVFCCFNNNYKITRDVFDIWMRILTRVDGSVLWLVGGSPTMERNLRSEAAAKTVNPQRLVFAHRLPLPEHQARLRLADLFLDTSPYNAGTTASDALWAGLPVLTQLGSTMAGRMAASVLHAIRLPELVTSTPREYAELAIELATNSEKLAAIKQKLSHNRLTTPLFDTHLFTRHIEAAYNSMYERYQASLPPDNIYVTP